MTKLKRKTKSWLKLTKVPLTTATNGTKPVEMFDSLTQATALFFMVFASMQVHILSGIFFIFSALPFFPPACFLGTTDEKKKL